MPYEQNKLDVKLHNKDNKMDFSNLSDAQIQALIDSHETEAIRQNESGGASDTATGIVNKASGAKGAFQVLPSTAANPGYGIDPSSGTAEDDARVGKQYYTALRKQFQSPELAAIAYNWGPGNTQKWLENGADITKLPKETLDYVTKFKSQTESQKAPLNYPSAIEPLAPEAPKVPQTTALGRVLESGGQAVEHPLEAVGSLLGGAAIGAGRLVTGAEELAGRAAGGLGATETSKQLLADALHQRESYENFRQNILPNTGFTKAGETLIQVVPTLLAPESLIAQAAIGSGTSALEAASTGASATDIAKAGGLGLAGGAIGAGLAKGAGKVLAGLGGEEVAALRQAGVSPTIGQTIGGVATKAEQAAQNIPYIGSAIKEARAGAVADLNKSLINEAISPLGKTVSKDAAIPDAISQAKSHIDDILAQHLGDAKAVADTPFINEVFNARKALIDNAVSKAGIERFDNAISNQVFGKTDKAGAISGVNLVDINNKLSTLVRSLSKDTGFESQQLAKSIAEVNTAARNSAIRNSPEAIATKLNEANNALNKVNKIERNIYSPSGLVSPQVAQVQQIGSPVLTNAGVNVLGGSVPNVIPKSNIGGGLLDTLGALSSIVHPGFAAPTALKAAYSAPGRKAISTLLSGRPQVVRQVGKSLQKHSGVPAGLFAALASQK